VFKNRFSRIFIFVWVFLILDSCASTKLPPIGSEKSFQPEEDEKQLWKDSERLEHVYEKSGLLYKDQELEDYLSILADKLVGQAVMDSGSRPRIKVVQNPLLNAFALPNGMIFIHSGMLARIDNEAELATVLGHELTHFTHRHSVKEMRSEKNKEALSSALQTAIVIPAAAFGVGQPVEELTGRIGDLWALSSVRGYSRELETEADENGLRMMIQAGYDPKESPKVFELLQQDLDERKVKEPFFFGTHPLLQMRIDNYKRLISTEYAEQAKEAGRIINADEFQRKILGVLLDNAVLDLHIGRTKTAQAAIEKHLRYKPNNPRAYFLLGEVYREESDTPRAIIAYQEAIKLDEQYAEPHREMGLIYHTQSRKKQARIELEKYLALNPGAVDGPIIKGYLLDLEKP
jgi:predicted Zn-dependent protease